MDLYRNTDIYIGVAISAIEAILLFLWCRGYRELEWAIPLFEADENEERKQRINDAVNLMSPAKWVSTSTITPQIAFVHKTIGKYGEMTRITKGVQDHVQPKFNH